MQEVNTEVYINHHKYWTLEEDEKLADLFYDGIDWKIIAKEMGRTEDSCIYRIRILRLTARNCQGSQFRFLLDIGRRIRKS